MAEERKPNDKVHESGSIKPTDKSSRGMPPSDTTMNKGRQQQGEMDKSRHQQGDHFGESKANESKSGSQQGSGRDSRK